MSLVAVVLPIHALITFCPGAKMSTTEPKLEKDARASAIVVAPTVFALGARAGDVFPASTPSFPAATVTWIPAPVNWRRFIKQSKARREVTTHTDATALSRAEDAPPPSDIEAIVGPLARERTKPRPETLKSLSGSYRSRSFSWNTHMSDTAPELFRRWSFSRQWRKCLVHTQHHWEPWPQQG